MPDTKTQTQSLKSNHKELPEDLKPDKKSGPKAYWEVQAQLKQVEDSLKDLEPFLARADELVTLFDRVTKLEEKVERYRGFFGY